MNYTLFFPRVTDYINSGLAAKNLRDPDNGIHLARKKATRYT